MRLATPSGTGEPVQPCGNCGQPVKFKLDPDANPHAIARPGRWVHVDTREPGCR